MKIAEIWLKSIKCPVTKYSCDSSILVWACPYIWTIMAIDYVTWKIVPILDYLNKEGIFITVVFCEFGLYFILMVESRLSAPVQDRSFFPLENCGRLWLNIKVEFSVFYGILSKLQDSMTPTLSSLLGTSRSLDWSSTGISAHMTSEMPGSLNTAAWRIITCTPKNSF